MPLSTFSDPSIRLLRPVLADETLSAYLPQNAFVSTRHRLFYVATPKVACTAVKWWLAELEGCADAIRAWQGSAESDPELAVHDGLARIAPGLTCIAPHALDVPLTSAAYLRFALVRNPYPRVFSAWQSKLLLQEPLQSAPYRDLGFFSLAVANADDLRRAFQGFLEHLAAAEAPNFLDAHWTPQHNLLRPDLIPYTCVSRIEDTSGLVTLLHERLGPDVPSPFAGRHPNASLIPWSPDLVGARSMELIRELYSADFAPFGYPLDPPPARTHFSAAQLDVALRAVAMLRARHQRITEQRNCFQAEIREQRAEIHRIEQLHRP